MEKTKFYNREDLKAKDVVRLIGIWEGEAGEDDIITEIADVMIMCEQLSYYFGKEKVELEKERKLERLKERLSKYTD